MARRGLWAMLALSVLVVLNATVAAGLPRPMAEDAPRGDFSAARAMNQLRPIAQRPHPIGSEDSDRVRGRLMTQLAEAGLTPRVERGLGALSLSGTVRSGRVENVVATLPGHASTGTVVLAAHYDSVARGPGAADDGASVAAMLETLRAVRAGGGMRNDLTLVFTDGEEQGLLGASAYVRRHPPQRPTVLLNWEARGTSGPSLMFETSQANATLIRAFASGAPHPAGNSALVELYRQLPNNTDFTVFSAAGYPGMNSAFIGNSAMYHTPQDTPANLSAASLQQHGANMLGMTRQLGEMELSTARLGGPGSGGDDATYFTFFGALVHYPNALVWPLALLAAAGALLLALRPRHGHRLAPAIGAGLAAASVVLPLALGGGLGAAMWWVLGWLRPEYTDLIGGTTYRSAPYLLAAGALAAAALLAWYLPLRRVLGPGPMAAGGMLWPAAAALLAAWQAPGMSYLFALPVLGVAVCWRLADALQGRVPMAVAAAVGAIPAALLLLPMALSTLSAEITFLPLTTGLFVLCGLFVLPIGELMLAEPRRRAALAPRRAWWLPAGALLLAALLVAAGLSWDRYDERHPRRTELSYVRDADRDTAIWMSTDSRPGSWARDYLTGRRTELVPRGLLPPAERTTAWSGPAPRMPLPAPQARCARSTDEVRLRVRSPRGAARMTVRLDAPVDTVTITVPGRGSETVRPQGHPDGDWSTEIRLADLPAEGARLRMEVPADREVHAMLSDRTVGLQRVPQMRDRPPWLDRSPSHDAQTVTVLRRYTW